MKRSFESDINLFTQGVASLSVTMPLVKSILEVTKQKTKSDLDGFLKTKAEVVEENAAKRERVFAINAENASEYARFQKDYSAARIANIVIPQSMIVALVSQFDVHVARLIRTMYYVTPEKLNTSQKDLKFTELVSFESLDDAREFIIEKEIESVLRESHDEQFKWLEKQLGIPLTKDLPIWSEFIEVTERRNLFVHTDGAISSQYIKICKAHGYSFAGEPKVGKRLPVTPDYFQRAFCCLFEMGVKLSHVMWRKLVPTERSVADENLNLIGYDLVVGGDYDLAINVLDFAANTLKAHSSEDSRLRMTVNLAQAYKWKGENEKCRAILRKIDWSALDTQFKLAHEVLQDNFDTATSLMRKLVDSQAEVDG